MAKNELQPRCYAEADQALHVKGDVTKRRLDSRRVANNTYLVRDGENIAVVLHSTAIVVWTPDGRVAFNSGGWNTKTTRERFDRYAPFGSSFSTYRGVAQFRVSTGRTKFADCQHRDGWHHRDNRNGPCYVQWHYGEWQRTGEEYSGEFRDGLSVLVADPGGTVRYDAPIGTHIASPRRSNSGPGYYDHAGYFGYTVYNPNGRAGQPPAVGPDGTPGTRPDGHPTEVADHERRRRNAEYLAREGGNVFDRPCYGDDAYPDDVETDAERLDRLEAGIARMRRWVESYSSAASEEELARVDQARPGEDTYGLPVAALPPEAMPPAAPVWTPRDKR